MPSYTNLILRTLTSPYGDVTRGGVLSWNDVDQNFLYLKGQSIYGVETSGVTVTLKKYNGSDIIFDVPKDIYVTGGTYNLGTATFINNNGDEFYVTGFTGTDTFVTGFTYSSNTITLYRNQGLSALTVDINIMTGLTVNGILSATTIFGDGNGLTNIDISSINNLQTSLDSKFDKSGGTVSGSVIITGDVTILGTATTINTETITVKDNIITINSNFSGNTLPYPGNSGIEVLRGSATTATLLWDESNQYWTAGISGNTKQIILSGDSLSLLNSGHTHPISEIVNLQTELDTKFDKSGGTINGNVIVSGNTILQSTSATTLNLTNTPTQNNSATDILVRNTSTGDVEYIPVSAITPDTNTYVTGYTYDDANTFTITQNNNTSFNATINNVTGLTVNGLLSATTISGDGNGLTNIDITSINNLQTSLDSKFDKSGGTINGDLNVTGNTIVQSLTATTISATTYDNLPLDIYVTGGTYNGGTATFTNNNGVPFDVTGFTSTDTFVTGFTYSSNTLTIQQNQNETDLNVIIDVMTGLTVNGTLSATTIFGDGNGLTNIDISSINNLQNELDSKIDEPLNPLFDEYLYYNGSAWVSNKLTIPVSAGAGVSLFLESSGSTLMGYELLSPIPTLSAETIESAVTNNNIVYIDQYATEPLGRTRIDGGIWEYNTFASVDITSTGLTNILIATYLRTSGGSETLLFTAETTNIITTAATLYTTSNVELEYNCNESDRLVVRYSGSTTNNFNTTIYLYHGGSINYSHIHTPFVTLHNDLSGIQGGSSNEHYHLQLSQLNLLTTGIDASSIHNHYSTVLGLSGGTVTGSTTFTNGLYSNNISATTISGDGNGLTNIDISSINNLQTSLDSKFDISGGTINGNLNVTGDTIVQSLTATTISATTYLNLPVVSGILGISNSGGTYTYYSAFTQALTASISGQTIEVFADIIETNDISLTLKDGVNINGNGHTYILNTSGISDCFIDGGSPITAVTSNLNVIRTGRSNGDLTGTTFNFSNVNNDITFINTNCYNTFGNGIILGNGTYKGVVSKGYLNGITSTNGNVYNAIGESLNSGYGIYSTGGTLHDSTGIAISSSGISWKGSVYKSIGKSSTSNGLGGNDETGPYYNSIGVSDSGNAIYSATCYNCNAISNSGIAYDSCNIHNSVGISNSNYALYTPSSNFVCNNSYLESTSNYVIYQRGSIFKNNTIVSKYNNTSGHAIYTWDNTDISIIVNNSIKVENSSAYGITGVSGSLMKYSNNIFEGCLIPVDSTNITQSIINTQDNQGNILL
jgi:hypothetical protein